MGYLVNDSFIIRRQIIIPEADVQQMDTSLPYTLVPTNNSFFAIPVFCYITAAANQTTPYNGFVHIHLTNTGNFTSGDLCATYSRNASATADISNAQYYAMLVNFQSAPNRFGGVNDKKDLQIFWDVLPPIGDGDLIVNLGYIIQPI
jgi:hypothetical protein